MPLHDTKKDGPTMFTRDNTIIDSDGKEVQLWGSYAITEPVVQGIIEAAVALAM